MHYGVKACAGAREWLVRWACLRQVPARRGWATVFALALSVLASTPSLSQVRYHYDELGRLIQVVAPDGQSGQYTYDAAGNITSIKKLATTAISISEFTPNAGPVGTTVTLYGTGFNTTATSNTVKFNGTTAVVSAATATSLTVTVPIGATTGVITVTNTNGTANSISGFVVGVTTPAPTITSFTPDIGTLGTVVTVTGSNFQLAPEDNKATFGATSATVIKDASSPAATQLKLQTPSQTASGKISVTTPYGKATSSADFYALPGSVNPLDVQFKGRLIVDGAALNIQTTVVGKKAVILFDGKTGQRLHFLTSAGTFAQSVPFQIYAPNGSLIETPTLTNQGVVDMARVLSGGGATGTYTVILNPQANDKGSLVLSVVSDVTGTLTVDGSTAVGLAAGRNGNYIFAAEAGKGYGLATTGLMLNPVGGNLNVILSKADGTYLATCGMSGIGGSCEFEPKLFASAGNYTLYFDPSDSRSATFNAVLSKDVGGTALTLDSSTTTVSIARPGQNGRYTFNGTAGQNISVVISANTLDDADTSTNNNTYVWLYKPSDGSDVGYTNLLTGTPDGKFDVQLPETGTYSLFVNPTVLDKGSIGVQLKSYLTGSLVVNGTGNVINLSAGRNARYTFAAEAGKGYGLALTGLTFTPANAGINVTLKKADGTTLTSCFFNANNNSCEFAPNHFAVAGTYSLEFDPSGNATAAFTAILSKDVVGPVTLDSTTATTVAIALAGQNGRYTFSGTAGQSISVVLSGSTLSDADPATTNYTWVWLYKPSDGSQVGYVYFQDGVSGGTLDVDLPETGTYTVFVNPNGLDKGNISLQVKTYVTGTLAVDTTTAVNLSAGRNARYTFTAEAGKGYGLALTNLSFTPPNGGFLTATLKKADGTYLTNCGFSNIDSCNFAPTQFATAGAYVIELDPSSTNAATFNAVLSKDLSGTLVVDAATATTVSIARAGQNGRYTFTGTAGQLISVLLSAITLDDGDINTNNYTNIWLYSPSDPFNQVGSTYFGAGTASTYFDVTLPQSGTYTLFIDPSGLDKGNIGVRVIKK